MLFERFHKKAVPLTPPQGLGAADVRVERSICTGEAVIGFREPATGKLLQAVAVRNKGEIEAFYRSYGYEPKEETL